jgi:hypothetical protein
MVLQKAMPIWRSGYKSHAKAQRSKARWDGFYSLSSRLCGFA